MLGGDLPPDVAQDASAFLPPVLIGRGRDDPWYTEAKMTRDIGALRARGARLETLVFAGGTSGRPRSSKPRGDSYNESDSHASPPPCERSTRLRGSDAGPGYRIFLPRSDASSPTASLAVPFWVSRTGFTSTNSAEMTLPVSDSISMARWASR